MGKMKKPTSISALKRMVAKEKLKGRMIFPTQRQLLATKFKVIGNDGTVYSEGLTVKEVEPLKNWLFIRGTRRANEALRMIKGYEHLSVDREDPISERIP